jgi:uncharacterized membrane protein (DUF2068 family)
VDSNQEYTLPLPDKKIPLSIMLIGTFEIAVALLGMILIFLVGQLNLGTGGLLILLMVYGALGTGLWAIQEWARFVNIILHVLTIPYILFTLPFWELDSVWKPVLNLVIAIAIIIALTRPLIRHKFQTVVPKQKKPKS